MPLKAIHFNHLTQASQKIDMLWVDSSLVGFYELPEPSIPKRRWGQILPWALDEISLDTAENLHIVIGNIDNNRNKLQVVAVQEQQMDSWKNQLQELGVKVKCLCPDVLALPLHESSWSILQRNDQQCLVRTGKLSGFIAHPDWLKQLLLVMDQLTGIDAEKPLDLDGLSTVSEEAEASSVDEGLSNGSSSWALLRPAQVHSYHLSDTQGFHCQLSNIPIELELVEEAEWPFNQLQGKLPVNLLQGRHRIPFSLGKNLFMEFNPAAALITLAIILSWLFLASNTYQLESRYQQLQQQLIKQIQTEFSVRPDPNQSLLDGVAFIEKRLSRTLEYRQQTAWQIMRDLDPVLSHCKGRCEVSSLNVKQAGMEVTLKGEAQQLQLVRQQLYKKPLTGYKVRWLGKQQGEGKAGLIVNRIPQ